MRGARGGIYISALDIAHIYQESLSNVYQLAKRHMWRRVTIDGRARYFVADVRKTFDSRRVTDGSVSDPLDTLSATAED